MHAFGNTPGLRIDPSSPPYRPSRQPQSARERRGGSVRFLGGRPATSATLRQSLPRSTPQRIHICQARGSRHGGGARSTRPSLVDGHVDNLFGELLNVTLDLRQLRLIHLLPLDLADSVERCEREDGGALVGGVDVVPLGLELVDELEPLALLKLAHAARPALVRLLHAPDVLVLVRDLLLDLVQVGRHLAEVGLLGPVDRLRLLLGLGEDVVHRVGRDEVLRLVRLSDRLVLLLALHLLRHRRLRLVLIFERRDVRSQRHRPTTFAGAFRKNISRLLGIVHSTKCGMGLFESV
mmetsp:Transcript_18887/g.36668  ORF Transcript_18887/g.36668 Transcript_18887/m.36668 type:complete len:294 (+) Transcript_18887:150-1031(+)